MKCEEIRGDLNAWIDQQLEPELAEDIARHLERCVDCARSVDRLRAASRIVEKHFLAIEYPSLTSEVMGRLPRWTRWGYALCQPVAMWRGLVPIVAMAVAIVWGSQQLGAVTHELERAETKRYIEKIYHGLKTYRKMKGRYPAGLDQLMKAAKNPHIRKSERQWWLGIPRKDAWGESLSYRASGDGRSFWLYSFGQNRLDEKGAGDDILPGL